MGPGRVRGDIRPQLDPVAPERSLVAFADLRHGVVDIEELRALGFTKDALKHRRASGRLHRLHRGVYAVGRKTVTQRGRWRAAVLACGPRAALSYGHCAHLLGLRSYSRGRIEVTVASRNGRSRPGLVIHRVHTLLPDEVTEVDHIPCTTWARTLLDIAACLQPHELARAIEQAEKQHVLDTRQTDRLLTRHPNHPGARRLRAALATAYPHIDTRSDNEALLTTLCHQAGLPLPQTNVVLTLNGRNVTVDALWPRHRLIVEVDSHTHHATRAALTRDHLRDADAQEAGYLVLRLDDAQLAQPRAVTDRLHRLLCRPLH